MKTILCSLLLFACTLSYSQQTTTFILVRHAEKQLNAGQDPGLTTEGHARAESILSLFKKAGIGAIYSTDFKRTRMTVSPLAKESGLEIQIYDWKNPEALLREIIEKHRGKTVIISGHSNTTPFLANLLLAEEKFSDFDDSDYGNLLIVTTSKIGEGKLLHLRF